MGNSIFAAILVLTIMVVPIVAALTRDLFLTVPGELRDGAEALGATRWETIRGVVIPTTQSGIVAASVLGFGRAIGEAIAVSPGHRRSTRSPLDLFKGGYTGASLIANPFNARQHNAHLGVVLHRRDPARDRHHFQPVRSADLAQLRTPPYERVGNNPGRAPTRRTP